MKILFNESLLTDVSLYYLLKMFSLKKLTNKLSTSARQLYKYILFLITMKVKNKIPENLELTTKLLNISIGVLLGDASIQKKHK